MPTRNALAKVPSRFYKSMEGDKHKALRYLSPYDKNGTPPVLEMSNGNFNTVDTISNFTVSTSTSDYVLVIFMPSVRGAVNLQGNNSDGTGIPDSSQWSTNYKFSQADSPVVSSPVRAGLRINNVTNSQNRDSVVRVLQHSSPYEIEWASPTSCNFTQNFVNELATMCRQHPRSKCYSAEDLATGLNELVVSPCSSSAYHSYGNVHFNAGITCPDIQAQFNEAQKDQAMNHVLLLFEPTSTVNKYSISAMVQQRFRYQANTLLNTLAKPARISQDGFVQRTHEAVQASGSELVDTSSTGVIPPISFGTSTTATARKPSRSKSVSASRRASKSPSSGKTDTGGYA